MHHSRRGQAGWAALLLLITIIALACATATDRSETIAPERIVEEYLDRYFETFPTLATAAGRHEFDDRLEDLDGPARQNWIDYNRQIGERVTTLLGAGVDPDDALDLELLLREARRQQFE